MLGREDRRVVRPKGFVPVEAKLRAPVLASGLVQRGQLVDRLMESGHAPVVLVTGPPGFGKTVVVAQWAAEDPRPFIWLSLDDGDNEPVVLVTYLLLALHRLEPVDPGVLATLYVDEPSLTRVVLPSLGMMLRRRDPFVLVLDQSDALRSQASLDTVSTVIHHLPSAAQVVLVARAAPALDWDGLRARHRLVEIGTDDLRLSRAEASARVREVGVQLAAPEVDALLAKTEGWPVATYLAAASLSAVPTQRSAVDLLASNDGLIDEYLRDQLLEQLAPEDRTFLARASVLSRLSGDLCDALLESTGSGETLRRLSRANLLLVAVDEEADWWRLHPLLRSALHRELLRHEPQIEKPLHARASRWLEEAGQPEEAIAHAVAAGEVERAGRLIWTQVPAQFATGRLDRLQRWLDEFTPNQLAGHARLALTAAALALQRGEIPDLWVASAERGSYEAERPGEAASVAGTTALLHATLARNGVVQMGADARLAMRLLDPDDPWLCTCGLVAAVSTYLTGHPAEGRRELDDVLRRAEMSGPHQCLALALTQLALIALEDDDWSRVRALVTQARTLAREHGFGALTTLLPMHCVAALLAAHDGRAEEAAAGVRHCASRVAVTTHAPPWLAVQCRQLLAHTYLLLNDPAAARTLLSEAQSLLASDSGATALRAAVERTWREIEHSPVTPASGPSTLTSAELRVLQWLPTHLSFEEIGHELFVSRNTVKTQAVSAYRKLGVSSRTEAVERAYALGLITR